MGETPYRYIYAQISGESLHESVALGYRYRDDADFRSGQMESWALYFSSAGESSTSAYLSGKWDAYASGVWRSPAGRIYVTLAFGEIASFDAVTTFDELYRERVGTALAGIWGLDDSHIWAYGGSPVHGGQVFFCDGRRWQKLPDPPAWIFYMHGCSADCVYGVGQNSVFRWDGRQWWETSLRATLALAGVWVESADELYVTDRGGTLFEGSEDGWVRRAEFDGPLVGVAKWKGKVWLGGEEAGLLQLEPKKNTIEVVKPKIAARHLEARGELLIALKNRIVTSSDGVKFTGVAADALERLTAGKPFLK